jgi:5-amino-6-(5-phosphoribosylamino)uracil reductase
VPERPYVLLSAAASVDGYIDDASPRRLVLSGAEDLDRVDEVRAGADAILVGAGTIRADDPRLLVRSAARRAARTAAGQPGSPLRVTLTSTGDLDPAARFFTAVPEPAGGAGRGGAGGGGAGGLAAGGGQVVYAVSAAADRVRELGTGAEVVDAGDGGLPGILADLAARGVARLLVEGGTAVLSAFLAAGLADELQLVIAPFLVGGGARLLRPGVYPQGPGAPMRLAGATPIGADVLLRYLMEPG